MLTLFADEAGLEELPRSATFDGMPRLDVAGVGTYMRQTLSSLRVESDIICMMAIPAQRLQPRKGRDYGFSFFHDSYLPRFLSFPSWSNDLSREVERRSYARSYAEAWIETLSIVTFARDSSKITLKPGRNSQANYVLQPKGTVTNATIANLAKKSSKSNLFGLSTHARSLQ